MIDISKINIEAIVQNLYDFSKPGIIAVPDVVVGRDQIFAAIQSHDAEFKKLPEYEGRVRQQMSLFVLDSQDTVFARLAAEMNKLYLTIGEKAAFTGAFNSYKAHFYPRGSIGLTAHQDFTTDANLIAIVMIAGGGKLYLCSNRKGDNSQEMVTQPGGIILMRAARSAEEQKYRPYHYVTGVQEDRYTIVARDEKK